MNYPVNRFRRARGPLTQTEFARVLGVTRQTLGNWERFDSWPRAGTSKTENALRAIARIERRRRKTAKFD